MENEFTWLYNTKCEGITVEECSKGVGSICVECNKQILEGEPFYAIKDTKITYIHIKCHNENIFKEIKKWFAK